MKYHFITNIFIALFIITSANAQMIEPEFVLTFQEWEEKVPNGFFHDIKVGAEDSVYIAVESGIYNYDKENNSFAFIQNTEEIISDPYQNNTISPLDNGDILIENLEQLELLVNDTIETLPNYYETLDYPLEKILSLHELVADDVNHIYFTAAYPLDPEGDQQTTQGLFVRDENGIIELYAGGGNQEIGEEPIDRLNANINNHIDDLFLFEDNSIAYAWSEVENNIDNVNKLALITPDGMVSEHLTYLSENDGRTLATKNHLFFDAGTNPDYPESNNQIKLISPDITDPIEIALFTGPVRWLYMDYSPTEDALYVLSEEIDRLVLWKVPNVLGTLQSQVKGWEIYE